MYITVKGKVLSAAEYRKTLGDAPLSRRAKNVEGWVKLVDNPATYRYFPGLLVQPQIDVQVGDVVKLAYEVRKNCLQLVDWSVEK